MTSVVQHATASKEKKGILPYTVSCAEQEADHKAQRVLAQPGALVALRASFHSRTDVFSSKYVTLRVLSTLIQTTAVENPTKVLGLPR